MASITTVEPGSSESAVNEPANAVAPPPPVEGAQKEEEKSKELSVEITDIKATGLPAKIGLLSSVFYVQIKGGKVSRKTKTVKYVKGKGEEFVASWNESLTFSASESSKVEIEVYARRFPFSYKVIKKTESKESLGDLLEHSDTPVELELLEEGQTAGKLVFRIKRSSDGSVDASAPGEPEPPNASDPPPSSNNGLAPPSGKSS